MKHEIIGKTVPAVEVELDKGEAMFTQSGAMAWMDSSIKGESKMEGGFLKGIGRKIAGESLFMVTYSSVKDGAKIAFASTVPGTILPLQFQGTGGMICQKKAFLCAQRSVSLETIFTKKLSAGAFGGEGSYCRDFPETAWHFWRSTGMR